MTKKLNKNAEFQQSKNDKMFYLVKDKNGKIVICVGGFMVSNKKFDTYKQAEEYLGTKPWEIIVNLIYVVTKQKEENEKIQTMAEETAQNA